MTNRVVVIGDGGERTRTLEQKVFETFGCTVAIADDVASIGSVLDPPPDAVLIDVGEVDGSPGGVFREVQERVPDVPICLSNAPDDVEAAVRFVRSGAFNYLPKGASSVLDCASVLSRAVQARRPRRSRSVARKTGNDKLVGTSDAMQQVFDRIGTAAQIDMNVIVRGESGTGKELVASTIHAQSGRDAGTMRIVDCTTVSPQDLERVLLEGRPGAEQETGPVTDRLGDRTVALDYVGQLSVDAQATLTRCLKEKTRRHGSSSPGENADANIARVIGLTRNRLCDAVQKEEFRKDLYFRLAQFPIDLPPLRERESDVLQLARYFLDRHIEQCSSLEKATLTQEAEATLQSYCWPGNVRELLNVMERAAYAAATSSGRTTIGADDLMLEPNDPVHMPVLRAAPEPSSNTMGDGAIPPDDRKPPEVKASTSGASGENSTPEGVSLGTEEKQILPMDELKRRAVERAYRLCDGDVDHAAVELDIGRSTMYRMLKRYDIRDD